MGRTCKEVSRIDFVTAGFTPSHQEIQTGSIQRIADAAETMAASHDKLRSDRDFYRARYEAQCAETNRLVLRISALRGVITKLKKGRRK